MNHLFGAPRYLPLLVPLVTTWQRARFPKKFGSHPVQVVRVKKIMMGSHGTP
jgi:hypothetical protein